MSGMNSDQLHRSTLGIYSGLMDEFNPSLQKLVSLGNSYVRAYQALATASEAYFNALSKIGEQAFRTTSSRSIGDILMQICQSQRRLSMELEGVFSRFSVDVLQEMENNVSLDIDYLSDSRKHYEMEVHNQAAALERQLRRGTNQDCSQYVRFLRESHGEALKEEERRYRFLAEKHCSLTQSITQLMNKTGGPLQQRAEAWTVDVDATRRPEARRPTMLDNSVGMKEEDAWRMGEEQLLGKIPSRAPSPVQRGSNFGSVKGGGGAGGGKSMRARADHQPSGSNPTLLHFTKGQMITALVQQPKNGWLYGRVDGTSRQGWFPLTYVEAVEDFPSSTSSSRSSLRSSGSVSSLLSQSGSGSQSGAPPPPPPPPPSLSSNKQSEMPSTPPTHDRKAESNSEYKRSTQHSSQPELFPRGTNPFATVKLRPTSTNDRSGPRLHR